MTERFVQLPTDTERSSVAEFEAATSAWVSLGAARGQAELLGALFAVLYRYTHQAHLAVDVFAGERPIAVDVDAAGDAPVSRLIDAAQHALAAPREATGPSNIAVSFVAGPTAVEGRHDVHFVFAPGQVSASYNARLLRPATVARLLESFAILLSGALQDRATTLDRLPLLSPTELQAIGRDSGVAAYPQIPVHRLFEALAKQQPARLAASFQGARLTYAELDARSSQLAHHLIACGAGPGLAVALCVRPSLEVLVAILAIWKARAIYLPLDPTHPEALIGRMLDEAAPRLVLTTSALAPLTRRFPQLCFDTDAALCAQQPTAAPDNGPRLDDPASLFYTSGTTGKPKGVVALQGNVAHYLHSAAQKYGFCRDDVFASLARTTFSISLFELLSPLCCGGSLRILDRDEVLTPSRLRQALEEVTVLHAGPSLLGSLFRYLRATPSVPGTLPGMRHASSGGDMVSPSIMEEMKRVFPNAELFVIYGCTEISCMGTTFPILRDTTVGRTFVGKPFPDVTLRVLDPHRTPVPFGVVGEICFAGKGIVRGYLDRPELTAEKFVERDGQRFYQTGDLGRLHADGNLEILGRSDFQIQLRGIRIELAGIEKTVLQLGLATQCAVVARTISEGDVRLVAFVVKPSLGDIGSFRRALGAELPDYMIPHHVVVLEAMPLTANGKLDRNQLKSTSFLTQLGTTGRTPLANERERKIAEVFARVLGLSVDEIGAEDSFFVGGDSLPGVVALEEIERAIGVAIPPHVLFERGTVRALAQHGESGDGAASMPIPLNAGSAGPPLFMLSGVQIYRALAKRLEGRCAAFGVFARREVGAFDPASGFHSIEELARDYVEIIKRQQPRGPYRLLGYSFAGIVAYEVAQQLRSAGEEVRFLALVDAALPEWAMGWRFRVAQVARLRSARPRDVGAFVVRRIQEKLRPRPRQEFMRYEGDAQLGPLDERRDAVNRDAAEHYVPRIRPFIGNVTLIASGERLRLDPLKSRSCGWSPYIPSLAIHVVEADHFPLIREEPYVSQMATLLAAQLQRAG